MRKYQPSGAAPISGLILMLIASIVAGVAAGLALFAVEFYLNIYLVVVFPILGAALVGGLLVLVIRSSKIRNPLLAGLIAGLGGLVMMGTYHFTAYFIGFRGEVRTAIEEEISEAVTDADLDEFINSVLKDEVGQDGFVGYLQYSAREGISITRATTTSSTGGIQLKDNLVWIYWGVELLIAIGVAWGIAAKQAHEPFDETAESWYGKPEFLATADWKSRKALSEALKKGDFQAAGALLTTANLKYPRADIRFRRSPNSSAADIFLEYHEATNKGRMALKQSGMVSGSEMALLTQALNAAPPAPTARR